MKRAPSDPATRRRRIDPLDTDLLGALEERDKRLYAMISRATRYRRILTDEIQRLRMGDDPQLARGILTQWDTLLREIQRLAADL
jgi:hypothetical protein